MPRKYILIAIIVLALLGIIIAIMYSRNMNTIKRSEELSEQEQAAAIDLVKKSYPGFEDYPAESLPPRSIVVEKLGLVFVAFVQEGSGVPYISAKCFAIDDHMQVAPIGEFQNSKTPMTKVNSFSAHLCKPIYIDPNSNQ